MDGTVSPKGMTGSSLLYSRNLLLMIIVAIGFAAMAAAAQLLYDHWGETELADGPIVPISLVWFVVSNYLCANAVYLYCREYVPLWLLVICWIGLAGGGTDHLIETVQWFQGNHQSFAHHWSEWLGGALWWFPFVAFGATSIIGIWAAVYVFIRYDEGVSMPTKILFALWALVAGAWGLVFEAMTPHSTVQWFITHSFITHLFLSLLPPIIVWSFAPHINLFSLLPKGRTDINASHESDAFLQPATA